MTLLEMQLMPATKKLSREEQNTIFTKHGLKWRRTTPEDATPYAQPSPFWLVGYNSEDGEEVKVISYHHTGGESLNHVIRRTQECAMNLAYQIKDLPPISIQVEEVFY